MRIRVRREPHFVRMQQAYYYLASLSSKRQPARTPKDHRYYCRQVAPDKPDRQTRPRRETRIQQQTDGPTDGRTQGNTCPPAGQPASRQAARPRSCLPSSELQAQALATAAAFGGGGVCQKRRRRRRRRRRRYRHCQSIITIIVDVVDGVGRQSSRSS